LAANPRLSRLDLCLWLQQHGTERSLSWLSKRRWLFRKPDQSNAPGVRPDSDGQGERALLIMRANPSLSLRDLTKLLADHGIKRSREWVRRNRCY